MRLLKWLPVLALLIAGCGGGKKSDPPPQITRIAPSVWTVKHAALQDFAVFCKNVKFPTSVDWKIVITTPDGGQSTARTVAGGDGGSEQDMSCTLPPNWPASDSAWDNPAFVGRVFRVDIYHKVNGTWTPIAQPDPPVTFTTAL